MHIFLGGQIGVNGHMNYRFNVLRYVFYGPTFDTNNFAFEVNAILGVKSVPQNGYVAKIGIITPMTNKVMVLRYS